MDRDAIQGQNAQGTKSCIGRRVIQILQTKLSVALFCPYLTLCLHSPGGKCLSGVPVFSLCDIPEVTKALWGTSWKPQHWL